MQHSTTTRDRLQVAVVGASGYSGEELIRLLVRHPFVELAVLTSRKYAGQSVGNVFPRFAELPQVFSEPDPVRIAGKAEVVFLALPHGLAAEFAAPLHAAGCTVVDISADFRLRDPAVYSRYYGKPHPAPQLLDEAVYGLPEFNRAALKTARLIACPGCYPTSVLLPLRPLIHARLVNLCDIVVASLSGVTGAGRKVDLPYIFPECNESLRPYAPTGHRHIPEIEQELSVVAGAPVRISFVPHLVPVNRGIHSTVFARRDGGAFEDITACLHAAYDDEPFVRVLTPPALADTKHVVLTNTAEIGCVQDERTDRVILSCAIDNLTKGAAGQAVQCMNLACGLPETAGLT
ncbi:MAG: N-acetyl-gamma-glutamyl-phosphate reductase [Kiritimatiellaeota bacterium]|nr:N-acetyl-gamma-glutamyl-phosphate reductase [Kiritimatiellota bacterium]